MAEPCKCTCCAHLGTTLRPLDPFSVNAAAAGTMAVSVLPLTNAAAAQPVVWTYTLNVNNGGN